MKKTICIISFIFALWLTIFAYFGRYATYLADDFCTANITKHLGVLRAQPYWYQNWSGRYSYNLLITFLEALGSWWVPLTAAASISFIILGFYLALRDRVQHALALSLAITTLALAAALDLGQLIYWPTGAATYPITLPLLALSIHFLTRKNIIATSLLVLLSAGFSEAFSAIQVGVFIVLAACVPKFRRELLIAAALAFTGAAMVAIAPGNVVRGALLPPHPALLKAICIALHSAALWTKAWIHQKWIEVVAAALLGFAWPQRTNKEHVKVAAMCLIPICIGTFLPSAWALGGLPPARTIFTFTTSALIFIGIAASSVRVDNRRVPTALYAALLLSAVAPAFVVYEHATKLNLYRQYADSWHTRDTLLRSSDKRGTILPLQGISLVERSEEPTCDAQHWVNLCMAKFYSLDSVATPKPGLPPNDSNP